MRPGEFCVENAQEILPDDVRRAITAEARSFAEQGREARRDFPMGETYWCAVVSEHARIIWLDAYHRRAARLERMGR